MVVDLTTEDAQKIMKLTLKISEITEEFSDFDPKIIVSALLNKMIFTAAQSSLTTEEFEHYLMFSLKSFDDLKRVQLKTKE